MIIPDCLIGYALSAHADYEVVKEFLTYCIPFLLKRQLQLLNRFWKRVTSCPESLQSVTHVFDWVQVLRPCRLLQVLNILTLLRSLCTMCYIVIVHEEELNIHSTSEKTYVRNDNPCKIACTINGTFLEDMEVSPITKNYTSPNENSATSRCIPFDYVRGVITY